MKKILAMILALAMILSMSAFAFADQYTGTGTVTGEENKNVTVNVTEGTAVYRVVVEWGNLNFTYKKGAWNTNTHTYGPGQWSTDGSTWTDTASTTITVTNHSDATVYYSAKIDNSSNNSNGAFTATWDTGYTDDTKVDVEGADVNHYGLDTAPAKSLTVLLGVIQATLKNEVANYTVGTITVTISHTNS